MKNLKKYMAIVLVISIMFFAGCAFEPEDNTDEVDTDNIDGNNSPKGDEDTNPTDQTTDGVAAVVNGEEIMSEEVASLQQQYSMQGQEIEKDEALEQLINQEIINQKAQEEEVSVSDEEAESMIEEQLSSQNLTLEDYKSQLETQGVSYEEQLEKTKEQIATQKYRESELEGKDFNVSDEEAKQYYEKYKSQSSEEIPSYEELKSDIIKTLEQQKQQEAIDEIAEKLKENADIEYK